VRFLLCVSMMTAGIALGVARADQIDTLARTAEADSSEKARIAAVVALGRLAEPRTFQPLVRALGDASPMVRGVAASALGHLGDARAVVPLTQALEDRDERVRDRAREAIGLLRAQGRTPARAPEPVPTTARFTPREAPRRPGVVVAVNRMGHKAPSSGHLTGRMHELLVRQLQTAPGVSVTHPGNGAQLVVDGAITKLSRELRGPYLEITCEVRLTVSNASGSLLSIVSGGATVQASRNTRAGEGALQAEALDNAIRGVHGNLVGFLSRQSGTR
jgi:hypothetical protein